MLAQGSSYADPNAWDVAVPPPARGHCPGSTSYYQLMPDMPWYAQALVEIDGYREGDLQV